MAGEDLLDDRFLFVPFDHETHMAGGVNERVSERDAVGVEFWNEVPDHVPGLLSESFGAREKRGGVAVGTHAEEEQVVTVAEFVKAGGKLGEVGLVFRGGAFGREFALDAEDVTGRDRNEVEEGLPRHAVITLFIVRRDATLVAERDLDAVPRKIASGGGPLAVNGSGCASAGKGDPENAALSDGLTGAVEDETCGVGWEVCRVENFGSHVREIDKS